MSHKESSQSHIKNASLEQKLEFMIMERDAFNYISSEIVPFLIEVVEDVAGTVVDEVIINAMLQEKSEFLSFQIETDIFLEGFEHKTYGYIVYEPFEHLEKESRPKNNRMAIIPIFFDEEFIVERKETIKMLKLTSLEMRDVCSLVNNCVDIIIKYIKTDEIKDLVIPEAFLPYFEGWSKTKIN